MRLTFEAPPQAGTLAAIPSKSTAHRLLICAAFARGETFLRCPSTSEDIDATVRCMNALGASVTPVSGGFTVRPVHSVCRGSTLDCGESGSTLRFLLPLAAALGADADFVRRGRLAARPLSPLYEELARHGARLPEDPATEPLPLRGKIGAGAYTLAADVSSQFVSGLLMAMPLLESDSALTLTGRIESADYIRITTDVMRLFGVPLTVSPDGRRYGVPPCGYVSPGETTVEGDWSNAALWLAAGAVGSAPISVRGLRADSPQGDRRIVGILREFGGRVECAPDGTVTAYPSALHGIRLDASQIPDLVPVIAAAAAAAAGETVITGIARLRLKESDRAAAVTDVLSALGAEITADAERMVIRGGRRLHGAAVSSHRDHRMVMCAFVASLIADGAVTVTEAQAVAKSYPTFTDDLARMGASFTESEDA